MRIRNSLALLVIVALAPTAWAQDKKAPAAPSPAAKAAPAPAAAPAAAPAHVAYTAKDLKWVDSPSLPGAKVAVLEGPMNEEKPFTIRIKAPAGFKIMPHTHPGIEHVTVISGNFAIGMGEKWDDKALHAMGPGDVMIMQPKTAHFATTKGGGEIQLHGMGPWRVDYVNPDDDPTKKKADAPKKEEPKKK
jgi:anti-sigma factor ChrR (cupin superfamily)